jgi:hypothetical protein
VVSTVSLAFGEIITMLTIARVKMSVDSLHCQMGHISKRAAEHMVQEGLVDGIKLDSKPATEFCVACTKAKIMHTPVPKTWSNKNPAINLGGHVHSDVWGPAKLLCYQVNLIL